MDVAEALGKEGVEAFLTHLAVDRKVAASTPTRRWTCWSSSTRKCWIRSWGRLGRSERRSRRGCRRSSRGRRWRRCSGRWRRWPGGVGAVGAASGVPRMHSLMANLLYGAEMRLTEVTRLRVKDVSLERARVMVRDGKGGRDRAACCRMGAWRRCGRCCSGGKNGTRRTSAAGAGRAGCRCRTRR